MAEQAQSDGIPEDRAPRRSSVSSIAKVSAVLLFICGVVVCGILSWQPTQELEASVQDAGGSKTSEIPNQDETKVEQPKGYQDPLLSTVKHIRANRRLKKRSSGSRKSSVSPLFEEEPVEGVVTGRQRELKGKGGGKGGGYRGGRNGRNGGGKGSSKSSKSKGSKSGIGRSVELPPTFSPFPTQTPFPTSTPFPTTTPIPTFTPVPTWTPYPTWTPFPTMTADPAASSSDSSDTSAPTPTDGTTAPTPTDGTTAPTTGTTNAPTITGATVAPTNNV